VSRYDTLGTTRGDAYVNKDSVDELSRLDALVFDCDGVLIDVRESYNACVVRTSLFLFSRLTGVDLPDTAVPQGALHMLKKSGGFNNDWDMAYSVLLTMLCELSEPAVKLFENAVKTGASDKPLRMEELLEMVGSEVSEIVGKEDSSAERFAESLKRYASAADTTGIASIRQAVSSKCHSLCDAFDTVLKYPGGVGESVLTTAFEEFFCGAELFKSLYSREPIFWCDRGLIENEKVIPTRQTFKELSTLMGGKKFGIASGRSASLAKYTLGEIIGEFKECARSFLEMVEEAERVTKIRLKKPHPYSLVMTAYRLQPFVKLAYIGDSMEDLLMTEKARGLGYGFSFIGVYSFSDLPEQTILDFKERGADLIVPSVNELPSVLRKLKGGSC